MPALMLIIYIIPLIFLDLPNLEVTSWASYILLFTSLTFWTLSSLKILSFIKIPKKQTEKYYDLDRSGKQVKARILELKKVRKGYKKSTLRLLLAFENLARNKVVARLELADDEFENKNFRAGQEIWVKLNRYDFDPPLIISGLKFKAKNRPIFCLWLIFHILYMISFGLRSYQNEGTALLNPIHPWIWSPIFLLAMMNLLSKYFFKKQDYILFDLSNSKSKDMQGEILLYGKMTRGRLISYRKTGEEIAERDQYLFTVRWEDDGETVEKYFLDVPDNDQLNSLRTGQVEIFYLPKNLNRFTVSWKVYKQEDLN